MDFHDAYAKKFALAKYVWYNANKRSYQNNATNDLLEYYNYKGNVYI